MSSSPWGVIQHSKQIVRGVRQVDTSSHGGIMVSKVFAEKNFSKAAINLGMAYGNYLCYEEDCDWAIPMFELKDKWDSIYGEKKDDYEDCIMKSLSEYYAEYLLEKGVTPLEPQYTEYKESKLRAQLERSKSPDLIVAAWGTWHTKTPGVIKVATADGKYYHIREDGYSEMRLKLLSKCEVIKEVDKTA